MPHITKTELHDDLYKKLFAELEKLLMKTDAKSVHPVLTALLTPTEQVMLTKRLSAIMFLHQGMTSYEVWNTLNMSPSTIARIKYEYDCGVYDPIVTVMSKSATKDFLALVELVLSAGLPPRSKDRWQHVSGLGRTK